jgi:8-hydroxy-5-deazaflavin:NADPH oxidoreductase
MKIASIGRGRIGGGLGKLWEQAGHEVALLGQGGGDVSDADAVLIAVPGTAVAQALDTVRGIGTKTVIDASNLVRSSPPDGYASNAEYIKSRTNGPTAKSFNVNFASLFENIADASSPPGNLWCGDEEARDVVEQLNRDAGYEPIHAGGLENAAMQEGAAGLWIAIVQSGMGPFFYRMAPPDRV